MAKFTIYHPVEIAIEYEAASLEAALAAAAEWQDEHTVGDMLDRATDLYTLRPKAEEV